MKVVVIGATGNVGSVLVRSLAVHPQVGEVVGVARRTPRNGSLPIRWVAADIASDDLGEVMRGADVVVHLAWLIQPTRDARRLWQVNVGGSARVFDAAAREGVGALVHASSFGVYSPRRDEAPVDESWPTHGIATSGYSREKAYAERLLDTFELRNPDTRVVRLRPGMMFSAHAAAHVRRLFVGSLLPDRLLRPDALPVLPRIPGLAFQAVHTEDAADAYLRTIVGDQHGAYNVAAAPLITSSVLAEVVGAKLVPVPRAVARGAVTVSWRTRLQPIDAGWLDLATGSPSLDPRKAQRELGWWPTRSGVDALREMVAAMRVGRGGRTQVLDGGDATGSS